MIKNSQSHDLDSIDIFIVQLLQIDGRLSNVDLARRVHLSPPATHARVRRLEQEGYIRTYTAILDRDKMQFDLLCFIQVSLQLHQIESVEGFRTAIYQMPEVLECYHLTGEYDYLLKVIVRDRKDLERFLVERLTPLTGVERIHTSIVFTEIKSTTALPLDEKEFMP
ncbi:MAG: Lrp/AsnC family transcriptional regulator [Chloroflexi bacterium AL-W]|nr:Lrp/AsnC family transcriptional regulator [Chloroflexi bacterium AL-N1]NOK67391.1 Lrp/AsnC family transcriptional regulator [Chloroflexi bacterium AL-N10]NOK75117.1 Lrp/AsnC family transcriptional regulator [Chloroflexi bacterium AL-N5]NOK81904.1 Lrp/AsnC family transcriptional regulator [Chloroflexi bacterium AL-W]NOK89750.1 Lrp/AsnC family transcriptional regulator [Chloroflexi bacterium AL-N15]